MAARRVAADLQARFSHSECSARSTGRLRAWGRDLVLFLPQTYMNLSGASVQAMATRYDLSPREILVIHDDADLPFGRLRIRKSGGSGGHNGIQSIIDLLGTQGFPRLRLGVANGSRGRDIHDFVLGRFDPSEEEVLEDFLERAREAVEVAVRRDIATAMNRFNRAADML